MPTATQANEANHSLGVSRDYDLTDLLPDEAEPEDAPHPLSEIKETVKTVRGRKVITTTCGPFRI